MSRFLFYRWMVLLGVFVSAFAIYLWVDQRAPLSRDIFEADKASKALEVELSHLTQQLQAMQQPQAAPRADSGEEIPIEETIQRFLNIMRSVGQDQSQTEQIALQMDLMAAEFNETSKRAQALQADLVELKQACLLGVLAGIALVLVGFGLWYRQLQREIEAEDRALATAL